MITTRKIRRALFAALPAWLAVTVAACMALPGFIDDIPPLAAALILIAVQPIRARRAVSAFRGGKSHRAQVTS